MLFECVFYRFCSCVVLSCLVLRCHQKQTNLAQQIDHQKQLRDKVRAQSKLTAEEKIAMSVKINSNMGTLCSDCVVVLK
jgi:hypothetical protein